MPSLIAFDYWQINYVEAVRREKGFKHADPRSSPYLLQCAYAPRAFCLAHDD